MPGSEEFSESAHEFAIGKLRREREAERVRARQWENRADAAEIALEAERAKIARLEARVKELEYIIDEPAKAAFAGYLR